MSDAVPPPSPTARPGSSGPLILGISVVIAIVAGAVWMRSGDARARALPASQAPASPQLPVGAAAAAAGAAAIAGAPAPGKVLQIAVIPKGTTHEFWKSIHAGAVKAERELDAAGTPVDLIWKGPLKEDDRVAQIEVVENFTGSKVDGMVLAPLDNKALVKPVAEAVAAGIPVVIIDSALESDVQSSFVATNNFAGGQLGGERLATVLGGTGKILLLRYQEGSASTMQREAGFLDAIAKHPGIEIVSKDQYAGATADSAFTAAQNLLNVHGQAIQGVFTPNESSTAGMILALKEAGLTGTVKHVGFDASPKLVAALKAGAVQGLVVQDPFQMGYLGVKHLADAIAKRPVAKQVDTPVQLVTPENLSEPAIRDLLNPPLDQYLK